MASALDAGDPHFDVSCRIFTISSSLAQGTSFIERVRTLGNAHAELSAAVLQMSDPAGSSMPVKIPWTISNKYYSANVHFAAHTVKGLGTHHLRNVPAVIFVWGQGEPYRDNVERIAQDLTGCEPEVCLAVRVPHLLSKDEDDSEIDAFLSSHGFEYVDATNEQSSPRPDNLHEGEDFAGIPRISRVLDALSTIMWPSMETKIKQAGRNERQKDREFLDWVESSQDDRYSTVEESAIHWGADSLGSNRGRVREMQELARWLEEDDPLVGSDPWSTAASSEAISSSPTSIEHEAPRMPYGELGFDDNFTVFVSAPAVDVSDSHDNDSSSSSPEIITGNLPATLEPPRDVLYHSLGSMSDFGGSDDEKREGDDNDDDDDSLPTQEDIRATSSRIFGMSPTAGQRNSNLSSLSSSDPSTDTFSFDSFASELTADEDKDSYEMAPFDLSKVLGTLETMKAEIGRMENEGERRKAAARVALGLVYGLESEI